MQAAIDLFVARDFDAAARLLTDTVAQEPVNSGAWALLAEAYLESRRIADALRAAERAVALAPAHAPIRASLGLIYLSLDRHEEALAQLRVALALDAAEQRARVALADTLFALERYSEAAEAYALARIEAAADPALRLREERAASAAATASTARPSAAREREFTSLLALGDACMLRGAAEEALAWYQAAATLATPDAPLHFRVGCALQLLGGREAALQEFDAAAALDPSFFEPLDAAARIAAALGLPERASGYLIAASTLQPSRALEFRERLVIAAINDSTEDIAQTRARWSWALDEMAADGLTLEDPLNHAEVQSFFLTYHGQCNRELLEKLATAYLKACPSLAWTAPHVRQRHDARIRIGFISSHLRDHSVGRTSRGLIAMLPRSRFEVFVINVPPVSSDTTAAWIRGNAEHSIDLDNSLERAREQIAALRLDVLFYQDIGMSPFTYFLAFARLATVQCVSFGHPDTSGIPAIDYFISNSTWEPPDAQQHYSERLFLLDDVPTLSYYYAPAPRAADLTRAAFGLDDGAHLYLCPQTLFKLHPDMDTVFTEILRGDPLARVVLIEGECTQWRQQLQRRFARSCGADATRVTFLPQLPAEALYQLMHLAEVMLDPIHFNGFNTSLEAFAVGTPVVTLPTQLQRGRHTASMYRKMEIAGAVVATLAQYIETALRLGTDADQRRQLSRLIQARAPVLYEDRRAVSEFERFFVAATDEARGAQT